MNVTDILDRIGSAVGFSDFYIPLGGSLYVDFYQLVRFVVFLFLVWFVARLIRFLVLRVEGFGIVRGLR